MNNNHIICQQMIHSFILIALPFDFSVVLLFTNKLKRFSFLEKFKHSFIFYIV